MYQAELNGLLKNIKKVDGYITYKVTGIQDDENVLWWISPRQINLLQKLVEQELKESRKLIMKMNLDKLTTQSEHYARKIAEKTFKRGVRDLKREIRKQTRAGEYHAILYTRYWISSEVQERITEYFEKQGFYIRKYRFGEPNEYVEVCWGPGIEHHKELDEIQLKMIEEIAKEEKAESEE